MRNKYLILVLWCAILTANLSFSQFGQGLTPAQVAGTPNKTAVQSGDWSSGATWGGSIPVNGDKVRIPLGLTVTVRSKVSAEMKSIDILGKLTFDPSVDTELKSEYVHGGMASILEIGTAAAPIQAGKSAKFIVTDSGAPVANDWWRYAPGLVLMGKVDMHGQAKTTWLELASGISAGATSMTLASAPSNWQIGDKLVLAATTAQNFTSDDVVTITSINGTTVNFSPATTYAHQPPAEAPNLKVHVANYTRNIVFTSENISVSAKRRGHLMFMHTNDVRMKHVEMLEMGRTDKTQPVNDFQAFIIGDMNQINRNFLPGDPGSPELEAGENQWGSNTNPRGRYSVHFHRSLENESPQTEGDAIPRAQVQGVTVFNDPGWGYVSHSSSVDFIENASYGVVGGAFNTEAGDELGSFVRNIALRTVNPTDPFGNPSAGEADLNLREGGMDFAFQGDAYWFHSHGVTIRDNVAAGVSGHSYVFWPEGLIEIGKGQRRGQVNWHLSSAQRALVGTASSHPDPELNGIPWQFDCWLIPAKPFQNNTAYSTSKGVSLFYAHSRFLNNLEPANPQLPAGTQGLYNHVSEEFRATLDVRIEGTKIWNIRNAGIQSQYASHVSIVNNEVYGYGTPVTHGGRVVEGVDLDHWRNSDNWLIEGNTIKGFASGAIGLTPPTNATSIVMRNNTYDNPGTDIRISSRTYRGEAEEVSETGVGAEKREPSWTGMVTTPLNKRVLTLTNEDFISQSVNNIVMRASLSNDFTVDVEDGFAVSSKPRNPYSFLYKDEITLNFGSFNNSRLYFDQQAADFTPITNQNYQWSANEETPNEFSIALEWRNKTNQQLASVSLNGTTGHSFSGEIMPAGATANAMITGGKVTGVSIEGCPLDNLPSNNFTIVGNNETCQGRSNGEIIINSQQAGTYAANINNTTTVFFNQHKIEGLAPGTYTLCIEVPGAPVSCDRCYEIFIGEGISLTGKSSTSKMTGSQGALMTIDIDKGTAPFTVKVNGNETGQYNTSKFEIVVTDQDQVEVTSTKSCEGKLAFIAKVDGAINLYPNPVKNDFTITGQSKSNRIQVEIYSLTGRLINKENYNLIGNTARISSSDLAQGLYLVKVDTGSNSKVFKMIKQ
ncbi:T9SS type A sorting domain-containing protein [Flagellimonas sp. CMM7]|uniref:T9SS type A sorting domain-containing protein n=1 Tax=Flagellimonas sp. CMM7 TaxID=2654676 RepID=UPI0013D1B000|nr:T9SS type A sorting domain-containing protein [Flagellimonas sp. CMM7]UII79887.1 T9SS type A sorting domain-containing protein [Flagellimonas sp. CMM7]